MQGAEPKGLPEVLAEHLTNGVGKVRPVHALLCSTPVDNTFILSDLRTRAPVAETTL